MDEERIIVAAKSYRSVCCEANPYYSECVRACVFFDSQDHDDNDNC